jgi:hypothetical protein
MKSFNLIIIALFVAFTATAQTPITITSKTVLANNDTAVKQTIITPITKYDTTYVYDTLKYIAPVVPINSLVTIQQDMTLNGEALPWSMPSNFNWYQHNNLAAENANGLSGTPGGIYANGAPDLFPWFAIFSYGKNVATTNTRVQVRNVYVYWYSNSKKTWILCTGANTARAYNDTYDTNTNVSIANTRNETTGNGGGTSIKPTTSYCIQGWCAASAGAFTASDCGGIWMYCEARLIVDNTSLPDDRASANLILCPGADYKNPSVSTNGGTVGGVCAGRFKKVTNSWRAYNISTVSNWTNIPTPPINKFD